MNICDLPLELIQHIITFLPDHAMLQAMRASPRVFVVPMMDLKRRKWKHLPFLKLAQWGDIDGFKYKYEQQEKKKKDGEENEAQFKKCLEWASAEGHLPIIKFVQERFPNIKSSQAMNWACFYGHLAVAKYLHQMGHVVTSAGLIWACENRHKDIVIFLYENGFPLASIFTVSKPTNDKVLDYLQSIGWASAF